MKEALCRQTCRHTCKTFKLRGLGTWVCSTTFDHQFAFDAAIWTTVAAILAVALSVMIVIFKVLRKFCRTKKQK